MGEWERKREEKLTEEINLNSLIKNAVNVLEIRDEMVKTTQLMVERGDIKTN